MRNFPILLLLLVPFVAQGEVFKWVDAQGRTHYGDKPGSGVKAERIAAAVSISDPVILPDQSTSAGAAASAGARRVVMYSTRWCGYCKKARKYFKANAIAFTEYDIEADAAARKRHKSLGGRGVPLILVGDKRLSGFSVASFNKIWRRK